MESIMLAARGCETAFLIDQRSPQLQTHVRRPTLGAFQRKTEDGDVLPQHEILERQVSVRFEGGNDQAGRSFDTKRISICLSSASAMRRSMDSEWPS